MDSPAGVPARQEIAELGVLPLDLACGRGVTVHAARTGPGEGTVGFDPVGRRDLHPDQSGPGKGFRLMDDFDEDGLAGERPRDETDLAVGQTADAVAPERHTRDRDGEAHHSGSSRKRSSGSTILSSLLIFAMASSGSAKRKMMAALPWRPAANA